MGNRKRRLLAVVLVAALLLLLIWWQPTLPGGPDAPAADPAVESTLLPLTPPPVATEPTPAAAIPATTAPAIPTASFRIPPLLPGEKSFGDEKDSRVWLTGVLTGPDGAPLGGVTIRLEREIGGALHLRENRRTGEVERVLVLQGGHQSTLISRGGRWMREGIYVGKTDEQGRFEILAPGAAGRYRVSFHPAGKEGESEILHRTGQYAFAPGAERSLGAIRIPRGGTIRGVVADEAGDPVEGATVSYWPDRFGRTRESFQAPGEGRADRVEITGTSFTSWRHGLGRVETDAEGRFTLSDVIPGTASLFAVAPSTTKVVKLTGYHVNEGEEIDGVRFVVSRVEPPILAGHVRDRDTGKPIRALMRLKLAPGSFGGLSRCGADGSFLIGRLPPGAILHVRAEGYEPAEFGPYTLEPEERRTGVEIRLRAVKE